MEIEELIFVYHLMATKKVMIMTLPMFHIDAHQ
jgi:hypothetical protein